MKAVKQKQRSMLLKATVKETRLGFLIKIILQKCSEVFALVREVSKNA